MDQKDKIVCWFAFFCMFIFRAKMWLVEKFGEFLFLLLSFSVRMCKLGVSLYSYSDVLCRLCTMEKDAQGLLPSVSVMMTPSLCSSYQQLAWCASQARKELIIEEAAGASGVEWQVISQVCLNIFQTHLHTYPVCNFQVRRHTEQISHEEQLPNIFDRISRTLWH